MPFKDRKAEEAPAQEARSIDLPLEAIVCALRPVWLAE
jgi:hypothetical protein